jgi:hypothetical protein
MWLKQFIKKKFGKWIYRRQLATASKQAISDWIKGFQHRKLVRLHETSYDIFTYHGEDGILLYLLSQLSNLPHTFADIGAGDCIKSNCANLAVHFNWEGLFIDKDPQQLEVGRHFYNRKIGDRAALAFIEAEVTAENVNQLLSGNTGDKKIGLLSIDIDGNDYWIWKAIDCIQPEIVVIEAKVEFGHKSLAVPYGKHNHHSVDTMYNGASVEAMRKLGEAKGYKLAGANKQGYNLFFIRKDQPLPAETTAMVLAEPATVQSFYPDDFFTTHTFENI